MFKKWWSATWDLSESGAESRTHQGRLKMVEPQKSKSLGLEPTKECATYKLPQPPITRYLSKKSTFRMSVA